MILFFASQGLMFSFLYPGILFFLYTAVHAINIENSKVSLDFELSDVVLNGRFEIANPEILKEKISVPIPAADIPDPKRTFKDISQDALKSSLPSVLQQFKVPANKISDLANKGIPLLNEAVLALFNEKDLSASTRRRSLNRRNILGDLFDFLGEVLSDGACGVFAAGALPAYLSAAGIFTALNGGSGVSTSTDQNYFIFPLHGDIVQTAPVGIHYSASFPVGFDDSSGVTMGRHIYVRFANAPLGSDGNFKQVTKLLLHELVHSTQYRSRGWSLPVFGTEYLFQYCKAGFSYRQDSLEVEAYNKQELLNNLLNDPFGFRFFLIWRARAALQTALGVPTERSITTLPAPASTHFGQLAFQKGVMQVKDACFRVFTNAEMATRSRAATCHKKPLCKRKPLQREQPGEDGGGGGVDPPECDPEAVKANNAKCDADKAAAALLEARAFDCSLQSTLPALPSPPKPGCPPNCSILSKIPITAKPCTMPSEDPPIGCFHDEVDALNQECTEKRKACGLS